MIVVGLMLYSSRETYNLMIPVLTLQIMARINEGIASRMIMPYRILLLVKRQILRHKDLV